MLVCPDLPTLITDIGDDPVEDVTDVDGFALAFKQGREEKISSEDGLFRKLNVRKKPATGLEDMLCWLWISVLLLGLMLPFR